VTGIPLLNASPGQVAQYAVKYTQTRFRVLSGSPVVRLARAVKTADLPTLGLPSLHFTCEEPPLMLVILQGDFDMRALRGNGTAAASLSRVAYIGYVSDLRAGMPSMTATSVTGSMFRTALADPTIPEATPLTPPPSGVPAIPLPPKPESTARCAYGSVAPTVSPPRAR
jgi:hypothetical protein